MIDLHFYVMKIGEGNRMRDFCLSKLQNIGDKSWLYIGYGDFKSWHKPSDSGWSPSKTENHTEDLYYLLSCSYLPTVREQTRVLVFSETKLHVFKITGPLNSQTKPDDGPVKLKDLSSYFCASSTPKWQRSSLREHAPESLRKKFKKADEFVKDPQNIWNALLQEGGFNYLPVEKVFEIDRDLLLPSINSLAVYRYLNAGTFRPLLAIGPGRNADLSPLFSSCTRFPRLDEFGDIEQPKKSKKPNDDHLETWLGFMARKYLQWLMSRKGSFSKSLFGKSSDADAKLKNAMVATLNPVQLEAAAALILTSLGMVVDFYKANSLDAVDLHARIPRSFTKDQRKTLIAILGDSSAFGLNKALLKKLNDRNVISIQCKDYELDGEQNLKDVGYFQPLGAASIVSEESVTWNLQNIHANLEAVCKRHKYADISRLAVFTDWMDSLKNFV